ncbi:hypothetical protein K1T71_004986 [Dendrolimus kikuchii]|uniref:Uncharacterized protein n=1 Tax=Dendrolimus kikuchii TaxID=765133 RepID=A0ACC1D6C4_9NEOP|nr:hypothetical protein K1T71_004986 [Dendrolimus kikuchii]
MSKSILYRALLVYVASILNGVWLCMSTVMSILDMYIQSNKKDYQAHKARRMLHLLNRMRNKTTKKICRVIVGTLMVAPWPALIYNIVS